MNKFKKTIATVLAMLMTISVLPMQAGAGIADDAAAEEDVEPIMEYAPDGADVDVSSNGSGVDTCEPIIDPQFTYADADQSATDALLHESEISTLDIWEDEPTDLTLKLGGISDAAAKAEGNSGNFKCLVPRSTIKAYADNEFGSLASKYCNPYMQGGCSDGKYMFYMILVNDGALDQKKELGRFILACHFDDSGKVVVDNYRSDRANSKLATLGHGNCLTYNSVTDEIVVACGGGDNQTICKVNADYFRGKTSTLKLSKHYISCRSSSIAFNPYLNRYVVCVVSSDDTKSTTYNYFCIFDRGFNLIAKCKDTNMRTGGDRRDHQGIYCDNNYIYALYYKPYKTDDQSAVQNHMGVYNWSGQLVREVNFKFDRRKVGAYVDSMEFESIFMVGNKVYAGMNFFYAKDTQSNARHFYLYDLSPFFFHIQYCPDTNVSKYKAGSGEVTSHVLYGVSTPIRKNTFTKKGYKFAGWSLYIPGEDIWSYKNDAGDIKWCKEGQQPAGYKKNIYRDKQNVSQTVKSGKTVFFCANWTATDYFYVFFNHNTGGSGTMAMRQVKYGTETQMPKNTFTKSGRTFKGWQIYNSDTGMWLYKVPNSTDTAWYKEGEAPAGYVKRVYSNGTTIARTIYAGQHLVFFAQWNEFIIYYDANGAHVYPGYVKTPTFAVYGNSNTVQKYKANETQEKRTPKGYRQHRIELDKWRYQSKTDTSQTAWFKKSDVDTSKYKLYLFKGSTVKETVQIGEHVVFQAQWS